MQIGRKIYYDLATGNAIVDTGERAGSVVPTTIEQDFQAYAALAERVPETLGVLEYEYGELAEDFAECNGYKVDLASGALVFSYPDPNAPQEPPVYQKSLTVQLAEVKAENTTLNQQLAQINGNFNGFVDQYYIDNPEKA